VTRATDLVVDRRGVARFLGRSIPCAIGRGGIVADKREGDGGTPVGVWQVESGYWRADRMARPDTPIPLIASGARAGWSDDPGDASYNGPVTLPHVPSHERMRRGDTLYDLVLVLDHNRHPAVPGEGSAIFVHCWRGARYPTAGCVAFARPDLLWIVKRWRPESRVVIRGP
jgi:L,D-peptidoglycan transpeptidase YkuD (ErfK/YbiS/YcfS/YnhG family)